MCWSDLEHCLDLFFCYLQWRTLQTCRLHLLRPQQQNILGLWIKVGSCFMCVWREVRWETQWKNLNTFFSHEYSSHPLTLAWMRVFYLGTPASPTPSRLISTLSQCPTDAHAPLLCGAGPKIDGVVFAGTTLPPLLTSFKSISSSSSSIFSS